MKLYILGNGFDLWHGIPTSYRDFYDFAQDTLDETESYFHIDLSNKSNPWHDFENHLGKYNWNYMYSDHDNTDVSSDDFKPSHVYGLQDELEELTNDLVDAMREKFEEWVESIDVSAASRRMVFDPDSRFITFNYTSTLQEIYGVEDKDVLHIHGRAGKDELVFGHGVHTEEEPELDPVTGDSNRTIFSDAEASAKYPLYALKKQVEEIIGKNLLHFTSLREVSEVIVIGHSLNDVDLPYFTEIAKQAATCRWIVYCFLESDREHHVQQLVSCGISRDRILTRSYDD